MLASRQVLGNLARGRVLGGVAGGARRLATVSDSALDRKVRRDSSLCARGCRSDGVIRLGLPAWSIRAHATVMIFLCAECQEPALTSWSLPNIGPPEQLGGEQLHQLQEDV